MIGAIIIDDESCARDNLKYLLRIHCPQVEVLGEASNAKEGIALMKKCQPQIVFLDIDMPGGSGLEVGKEVNIGETCIVYTTAHEKYALSAFKTDALDYLLKPIDASSLIHSIEKCKRFNPVVAAHDSQLDQRLAIPGVREVRYVDVDEIIFLEANRNYCSIYLNREKITSSWPLAQYVDQLDPDKFLRVHKSYLVNVDWIQAYQKGRGGKLILKSGHAIDVARSRKAQILPALIHVPEY